MKQTAYYIELKLRTCEGFESFGRFSLVNNKRIALDIFKRLKGSSTIDETSNIRFDLMETTNNVPVSLQMITCSLNDLSDNCKFITIETFRLLNLKTIE
ncbi:MAG: hypothetical protein EOO01_34910 [Chitinophagaceae bacterium]|nr:MAG: hypothetical protein EOO01_34910 [Chitinophagaceae bacterium]